MASRLHKIIGAAGLVVLGGVAVGIIYVGPIREFSWRSFLAAAAAGVAFVASLGVCSLVLKVPAAAVAVLAAFGVAGAAAGLAWALVMPDLGTLWSAAGLGAALAVLVALFETRGFRRDF